MDELGPHERRLLDALQEDDSPTLKDADRIKERVLLGVSVAAAAGLATATGVSTATGASVTGASALSGGAQAVSVGTTASVTGTAAALTGKAALASGIWKALLVVGATAGLFGGAYLAASVGVMQNSKQSGETATDADSRVEPVSANDPISEGERSSELSPISDDDQERTPAEEAPPVSRKSKKPEANSTTSLKDEAALLQKAQAALQNGNPQGALTALAEHKAKFPRGVLAGEREAALSVAYCNAGDLTQGRTRARAFIAKDPGSPMVQRLQAACKLPSE